MAADEQPALVPISQEEARRIEDELRTSRQGAWYADLYRRHGDEAAALVHSHRRVTVVWHRSGAAELFQWLWRAFKYPDVRLPAQIQGRPVRACLEELAAALERNGSDVLTADVRRVLPVLPDVAGLTQREIVERLKGSERATAGAPA
jgi:IS1 family transposase